MFRELARKNKQLSAEECAQLLQNEKRGVLSVIGDNDYPYGMPMNHFYNADDGKIYFHCGKAGHRLDALRKSDKVSFCVYDSGYHEEGDWALNIKSVIVFGRMEVVENMDRVVDISRQLCYKFTQDEDFINTEIERSAKGTLLLELTPEHICGKFIREA